MTDHTEGPWEVVQSSRGGPFITRADKKDVIQCPGSGGALSYSDTICQMHWSGTTEWTANARLIAAAPELLEALTQLETWSRPFVEVMPHISAETLWREFPKAREHARAAIAKATS